MKKSASPPRYSLSSKNAVAREDAVNQLVEKYSDVIVGHLTGFDRLVMRGSIRNLVVPSLFKSFLGYQRVLLKDFADDVRRMSRRLTYASSNATTASRDNANQISTDAVATPVSPR
jgi:activator of HSP90 ATPase